MRGIGFGREQLRVQVSTRFPIWVQVVARSSCGHTTVTSPAPCHKVWGSNLTFKFCQYLNLNLPRSSGSHILSNLIPEPQVPNQVWTRFEGSELDHGQSNPNQAAHEVINYPQAQPNLFSNLHLWAITIWMNPAWIQEINMSGTFSVLLQSHLKISHCGLTVNLTTICLQWDQCTFTMSHNGQILNDLLSFILDQWAIHIICVFLCSSYEFRETMLITFKMCSSCNHQWEDWSVHWIHILVQTVEYTLNLFCLHSRSNTYESLKPDMNIFKICSSWIWLRTWKLHSEYNHSVLTKSTEFQSRHHSPFVQHVSRGYMDWSPWCQREQVIQNQNQTAIGARKHRPHGTS